MNERRKKAVKQIAFGIILLAIAGLSYWFTPRTPNVSTFSECAEAGNPILESFPLRCRTSDGKVFRQDIGNMLEKDELIRVESPWPNVVIKSPLVIKGMARGNWFFEASFPVKLLDNNEVEIAHAVAQANPPAGGDWMTSEFVPFEATLTFTTPTTTMGVLLLNKDNPSGLPELDDVLRVPVWFR